MPPGCCHLPLENFWDNSSGRASMKKKAHTCIDESFCPRQSGWAKPEKKNPGPATVLKKREQREPRNRILEAGDKVAQKHADRQNTFTEWSYPLTRAEREAETGSEKRDKRKERWKGSYVDWFRSFPSEQFQALLTLFSKFFASFPRGTCTLSVFGRYLALDGNYRPERLGLQSQTVRLDKEQTPLSFES